VRVIGAGGPPAPTPTPGESPLAGCFFARPPAATMAGASADDRDGARGRRRGGGAMRFLTKDPPDGDRLFRVVLGACIAGGLAGGLFLLVLWAVADFDAEVGRAFVRVYLVAVAFLALASLTHYPWSRRWCEALGARYTASPNSPAGG